MMDYLRFVYNRFLAGSLKLNSHAINSYESGNYSDAAAATAHVVAVGAAYAAGTLVGFGSQYAISGLGAAIKALGKDPAGLGKHLMNMGLIDDPLVAQRITNVGKAFGVGAAAASLVDQAINLANDQNIGSKIYDLIHPENASTSAADYNINSKTTNGFNSVTNPPRKDPLTLDLNGNGLDSVGISRSNPILFDQDGDGVKTSSGWVLPSDGFLVRDRNKNGMIDNGSELFGDSTPVGNVIARDGFAALKAEDTNSDGKVNILDSGWAALQVWRDLNQNGISEQGELYSMQELGIESFIVEKKEHSTILANGNQLADLGTYIKADGTLGTMGDVAQMADINLAQDTFHSQFTDSIPVTAEVQLLPQIGGSGLVRSLREASTLSPVLRDLVARFSASTDRDEQRALVDSVLQEWAGTSHLKNDQEHLFSAIEREVLGSHLFISEYGEVKFHKATAAEFSSTAKEWQDKIYILEAFNGRNLFNKVVSESGGPLVSE